MCDDFVTREGKEVWGYLRLSKNVIKLKDSILGFHKGVHKVEFMDFE